MKPQTKQLLIAGGDLTPRELDYLRLRCEEELTLGEIARRDGITRSSVGQVFRRIARKLGLKDLNRSAAASADFTREAVRRGLIPRPMPEVRQD